VKRKVGLFLLGVIVAVTLGATLAVSLAMYRLVSANQDREIRSVEASLGQRFTIFEVMLRSQHGRINAHMEAGIAALAKHDLAAARLLFEQCLARLPGDPAATSLLQRCA
jgi:hypothetical protein